MLAKNAKDGRVYPEKSILGHFKLHAPTSNLQLQNEQ
jgi:hypothetical protein